MTKLEFIAAIKPYAQKAAAALAIPDEFVIAHWAHETGYHIPATNNLAGIYAYQGSPYGPSGKRYTSLDDFTNDYISTLQNQRYRAARNAKTVYGFARALQYAGYASDPFYSYSKTWEEAAKLAGGTNIGAPVIPELNKDRPPAAETRAGITLDLKAQVVRVVLLVLVAVLGFVALLQLFPAQNIAGEIAKEVMQVAKA